MVKLLNVKVKTYVLVNTYCVLYRNIISLVFYVVSYVLLFVCLAFFIFSLFVSLFTIYEFDCPLVFFGTLLMNVGV